MNWSISSKNISRWNKEYEAGKYSENYIHSNSKSEGAGKESLARQKKLFYVCRIRTEDMFLNAWR